MGTKNCFSETSIEKIRQKHLGLKHSNETKQLQSNAKLGEKNHQYGKIKELCPNWKKVRSEETRNQIAKTLKNKPKIICKHCGKSIDIQNHNRWHGDNCKFI